MRFLFVDQILQLIPGQRISGIKHITRDDYYLFYNEEGLLCFIPSLIGEALGQLAAWNVMFCNGFTRRPVAGIVSRASLYRPAYVGETLLLESTIDSVDEVVVRYCSVARVGDEEVFRIEGALGPLLPMTEFIALDVVRQQFREIDHAGVPLLGKASSGIKNTAPGAEIVPPSFINFDRILHNEPGVRLSAEKYIDATASYFPDHFPNKPVLPMSVLLECKLNLAREFLARADFTTTYYIRELRKIKMKEFIHPGDRVICHLQVKHRDERELILSYCTERENRRICVLDVVLAAKDQ